MTEQALRLPTPEEARQFPTGLDMSRICYWKDRDGRWFMYLPRGGVGDITNHQVTEHEDGTITVSPSILLTSTRKDRRRHGFLKRGVWEPCGDDVPLSPDGVA